MKIAASVIGASGYAGGELLRILLLHPEVEVRQAASRSCAGQPVALVHPNLRGLSGLTFCRPEEVGACDVLFVSLPHGESMKGMERWMGMAERVIDLGADFRLSCAEEWEAWYGTQHASPHLLERFALGIPEIAREKIKAARYVAIPGCEAVVSILCLYPLFKQGLLRRGPLVIDAKMGSSQAGHSPSVSSHHPERAGAVRSYKPTGHRHAAEILRVLREFSPEIAVAISATAVEMVRGILVTIHTFPEEPVEDRDVWNAFRKDYSTEPFVRIVKAQQGLYRYPEPKILQGTNYCDIGFEKENGGPRLVVIGAIDNLVKGTAGNAVQCLNLMCGFEETAGLRFPGLHPV